MEPRTETVKRKPKGRVNPDDQEQVQQPQVIEKRIDELVRLKQSAETAAEEFAEGVKAAAEDSGMLASVVRRFVTARASEKFEERRRECEQLSILFEEIGE